MILRSETSVCGSSADSVSCTMTGPVVKGHGHTFWLILILDMTSSVKDCGQDLILSETKACEFMLDLSESVVRD